MRRRELMTIPEGHTVDSMASEGKLPSLSGTHVSICEHTVSMGEGVGALKTQARYLQAIWFAYAQAV